MTDAAKKALMGIANKNYLEMVEKRKKEQALRKISKKYIKKRKFRLHSRKDCSIVKIRKRLRKKQAMREARHGINERHCTTLQRVCSHRQQSSK